MNLPHSFTGTYDGRAGACVNCDADPYEVLGDLYTAGSKAQRVLDEIFEGRKPASHHIARYARELATALEAVHCPGYSGEAS